MRPKLNLTNQFSSDSWEVQIQLAEHLPSQFAALVDKALERITVAINTNYPEIFGGYYVNSRVLQIVANALSSKGLLLVNPEYQSEKHACPTECLVGIEQDTLHELVDEQNQRQGWLLKWQFDAGGGGSFIGDNLIVDLLVEKQLVPVINHNLNVSASD